MNIVKEGTKKHIKIKEEEIVKLMNVVKEFENKMNDKLGNHNKKNELSQAL
jgi:hypothetical protein